MTPHSMIPGQMPPGPPAPGAMQVEFQETMPF